MNFVHKSDGLNAQSTPLESYVVRIYRRNLRFPARLTGTVEVVADGSELRFNGLRELQRILMSRQSNSAPSGHHQ